MKQYSVYTKLDGHIGKFSGGELDVTKAYVDEQLETKANTINTITKSYDD